MHAILPDMDAPARKAVGERVARARINAGLSKEEAARQAGISSITVKRIEDGLPVQETKLAAVLALLDTEESPTEVMATRRRPPEHQGAEPDGPSSREARDRRQHRSPLQRVREAVAQSEGVGVPVEGMASSALWELIDSGTGDLSHLLDTVRTLAARTEKRMIEAEHIAVVTEEERDRLRVHLAMVQDSFHRAEAEALRTFEQLRQLDSELRQFRTQESVLRQLLEAGAHSVSAGQQE